MTYRLAHLPDRDTIGTVSFAIAEPADAHEALVLLRMSAQSWESQDSPEEILLDMSTPATEEPDRV